MSATHRFQLSSSTKRRKLALQRCSPGRYTQVNAPQPRQMGCSAAKGPRTPTILHRHNHCKSKARAGKSRQEQYIGSHPNLERASIQRTGNTRALQTARITRSREKQMSPADRRLKMTWPRTVARRGRISETRQQGLRSAE